MTIPDPAPVSPQPNLPIWLRLVGGLPFLIVPIGLYLMANSGQSPPSPPPNPNQGVVSALIIPLFKAGFDILEPLFIAIFFSSLVMTAVFCTPWFIGVRAAYTFSLVFLLFGIVLAITFSFLGGYIFGYVAAITAPGIVAMLMWLRLRNPER
ncbi:hypothetical protein [Deinococcus sp.]|uniref:hypothetical protein n=1 Tax=Deinococcus sp. TaxID=47478 RepID=UPI003B5CB393